MSDDFEDDQAPPHPFDYISKDAIQDLWGIGYTIVKRAVGDPFDVPAHMVPATRSYQWMHLIHDKQLFLGSGGDYSLGWAPVPASRHDGVFMPFGTAGAIEVSGLGLFEKPKFEVDAERQVSVDKAKKQVSDWIQGTTDLGISGSVSFGDETATVGDPNEAKKFSKIVDNITKTIETTVDIPRDMIPYIVSVFKERDELYAELIRAWETPEQAFTPNQYKVYREYTEALKTDPDILKGPTLNALLLPIAIANIRKTLNEEKTL